MTNNKHGGAAFPGTLRDYFAGQIIAGALANPDLLERIAGRTIEQMAREVYEGADALLAAREAGE